jgi:hypothetical protein
MYKSIRMSMAFHRKTITTALNCYTNVTPGAWYPKSKNMADAEKRDKIDQFKTLTGVNEERARFYLESALWQLDVCSVTIQFLKQSLFSMSLLSFISPESIENETKLKYKKVHHHHRHPHMRCAVHLVCSIRYEWRWRISTRSCHLCGKGR